MSFLYNPYAVPINSSSFAHNGNLPFFISTQALWELLISPVINNGNYGELELVYFKEIKFYTFITLTLNFVPELQRCIAEGSFVGINLKY